MDISGIIESLKAEHCGKCKVGAAIVALEEITRKSPEPKAPVRTAKGNGKSTSAVLSKTDDPKTGVEKACKKCNTIKPLSAFPKNHLCRDGHTNECKACASIRHAADNAKRKGSTPAADSDFPKNCELCHSVCSSRKQYERHMELVHHKAA